MKKSDLVRELREANQRLTDVVKRLEDQQLRRAAMTADTLAELRWLARDYDDQENGDWTR
jgi:hypothetical protein